MSTDPSAGGADLAALRRRLYQPDATDEDRAAYEALRRSTPSIAPRVSHRPTAAAVSVSTAPDAREESDVLVEPDPPPGADGGGSAPPVRRRLGLRPRVLLGAAAAVAVAVIVAALLHPAPPDLGSAAARTSRLVPLPSSGRIPPLPGTADSAAVAAYFGRISSTAAERSTAARKPFFGAGTGPTDFTLQGFDIGADTASVTVVTDRAADASVVLAVSGTKGLRQVLRAAGPARALEPVSSSARYDGLDEPRVLRVDVPPGVPFVVRSVFLTPVDAGVIDR